MKLLRHKSDRFVFEMARPEKALLAAILKAYPLVPMTHHQLSRATELPAADQQLLAESLAAQQSETQDWVQTLLAEPDCFKVLNAGFQFAVSRAELEGLLQVMNDLRVGSWLALGSPETEDLEELMVNDEAVRNVQRLHLAGFFQMNFLTAVGEVS